MTLEACYGNVGPERHAADCETCDILALKQTEASEDEVDAKERLFVIEAARREHMRAGRGILA